jgi:hypothetical protein
LTTTGGGTACSGQSAGEGCVIAWIVNNPNPAKLSTTPVSDVEETFPTSGVDDAGCWGTGGFVIDNASTATGASNIYFPNMNGNSASAASSSVCNIVNSKTIQAVQASQTNVSE